MNDSGRPNLEDHVDRYARGELTAAEGRALAQSSLDEPELFADLTYAALAKASLVDPSIQTQLEPRSRMARVAWLWAGAAAAAVVVVLGWSLAHNRMNKPAVAVVSLVKPVVGASATADSPVLLASDLRPEPRGRAGQFRSPAPEGRSPQSAGSILSIQDGEAAINLGSLDGLVKGSGVEVFRQGSPVGRLVVTTIFRERARAKIPAGQQVQVNDQVRGPGVAYYEALLQKVDALAESGEPDTARTVAEQAVEWADTASVPPAERWKALDRLGALEYQAGLLENAEKHYQTALQSAPAQAAALNALAVLRILRGDYNGARVLLDDATSKSAQIDPVYCRSVNNLGVVAELGGDRRKAEALYTDARRALDRVPDSTRQDRIAVETNLARVRNAP